MFTGSSARARVAAKTANNAEKIVPSRRKPPHPLLAGPKRQQRSERAALRRSASSGRLAVHREESLVRRAVWMVVAGLVVSCIRPPASSPVQSGQAWVALQSKHFRVISDLDEGEADRVVGGFEETYDLLGEAVFGAAATPSVQTSAIIFANHQDLNDFIGEGFDGMYMPSLPNDVEPSPIMLAAGTLSPFARLTFAHELTHRFNHVALGPTPTWLNEGLADYYCTIRSDHGKPVLGEIDPRYMCTPDGLGDLVCWEYEKLPGQSLPTASQVMALDRQGFYGESTLESGRDSWEQKRKRAANYGVAWLLVHLLMTGSQDYAQEFRRVLAGPPSGEKGAKLADVLGRVPKAQLDGDFKRYLEQGIPWRQHHLPSPPTPSDLERHTLSNSEVLLLWARIDLLPQLRRRALRSRATRRCPRRRARSDEPHARRHRPPPGDVGHAQRRLLRARRRWRQVARGLVSRPHRAVAQGLMT
jgi:hypothetical protein